MPIWVSTTSETAPRTQRAAVCDNSTYSEPAHSPTPSTKNVRVLPNTAAATLSTRVCVRSAQRRSRRAKSTFKSPRLKLTSSATNTAISHASTRTPA